MNRSESPANIPLACQELGTGAPIVLVHGWGVSGAGFECQAESLAARHHLLIPDLPSHGATSAFPRDGAFSLLADSLAVLIASRGLQRPIVVGWSLGAMVSWDLALRHPELEIAGLVAVDIMPRVLAAKDWRYGLGEAWMSEFDISLEAMRADWPGFCASFVPGIFAESNEERLRETIARLRRIAEQNDADGLVRIWQQLLAQDFRHKLRDLDLPAMLICGARTRLWEKGAARWMAEQFPNWHYHVFEQSGHSPHIEEPDRFNQVILEFAAEVHGARELQHTEPAKTGVD